MGANSNVNQVIVSLTLVSAEANDLRNIKRNIEQPDGSFKPEYERRLNLPFWLRSLETNEIEPQCYFLDESKKPHEIKEFLDAGNIFIHELHKRNS
ncbi:conserved protein of unknown function [Tenacibaculum sp. 190130A14a]|uniref:Uncharacterized protein n=1 Tax=Tenacibaculum polynesiense TaxID=3137857 RepID=A0ABP1ESG2_9FLAO